MGQPGRVCLQPRAEGCHVRQDEGLLLSTGAEGGETSVAGGVASYFNQVWPVTSRRCGLLLQGGVACYFKGVWPVTSRRCGLLLQGGVACYFKGVWPVTSRRCGLLLQGGVACYFKEVWPVTSRRCGLLLQGGVACYFQEVWHIISMKCGVLVQEGNVLCTDCCFGPWCSVVNVVQCDSSDMFCYRKCISPQQLRTLSRLLLANMTDQNMFR